MIKILHLGPIDNNAFILTNKDEAILIDAPPEGKKILKILKENNLKLKYILLTHVHWDHIESLEFLKKETNAKVIAHEDTKKIILNQDIMVEDNQILNLLNKKIKVLHAPGHSLGDICFYLEKEKLLFTGDILFKQGIGRTDFPGGNQKLMINSLKKLLSLPRDTSVFPGHGQETTIEEERKLFRF